MALERDILDEISDLATGASGGEVLISTAGRGVRFRCDDQRGIEVVRTVFGPYCDLTFGAGAEPGPDEWQVTAARADLPEAARRLIASHAASGGPVTPVRRWGGDFLSNRYDFGNRVSVVVHERPFAGLTAFFGPSRQIVYLRSAEALDVPHTEHTIKYPLRVTLRQAGLAQVHAAATRYGGRGILIMGRRASGKSTLLCRFLSRGGKQISNDLGFVRTADDGNEMIAFPHMTRMALGTVNDNAELRAGLGREERTGDYLRSPIFNDGKEEFYPPVLERIWGAGVIHRRAPLDVVLFPVLDLERRDAVVRRLSADEAAERVRHSLVEDPPLPDWLPIRTHDELRALAGTAATALLRHQPLAFEVGYGPQPSDPVGEFERAVTGWPADVAR